MTLCDDRRHVVRVSELENEKLEQWMRLLWLLREELLRLKTFWLDEKGWHG